MFGKALIGSIVFVVALKVPAWSASSDDERFDRLASEYLDRMPALSPVGATLLGDHRFDSELDDVSPEARRARAAFAREFLGRLARIDRRALSRDRQVDAALLEHALRRELFELETLQEWAWNPLLYTRLAGSAIYGLMARDFAPLPRRLESAAARLLALPRFFEQVRAALDPARVPRVHAETAARQTEGLLAVLDEMVRPRLDALEGPSRRRLERALESAREAIRRHQRWLEEELVPAASGDFRLGPALFDAKLRHTLFSPLGREEIRSRAEAELARVREEMYGLARQVYARLYPYTEFPENPSEAYKQAIIRAALEVAYRQLPDKDALVETAQRMLDRATAFVREHGLVSLPEDPVEIIVMPEYQRGVAVAYCDAPGPLDVGQKTFFAVAPLPAGWTDEQVRSFLREYNLISMAELTVHEAMPGHYLQLARANRYPSRLRAVLASGPFIEGWAVYAEKLMADAGFPDDDPLTKLVNRKWYLRVIVNALIDQGVHTSGMTREEAMRLMVETAFQEKSEAEGKWRRAQLTAVQLSTYFVGYLGHADLRREAERRWGDAFDQRRYHDRLLSFGSPPVQFVRALLFDLPIPASPAETAPGAQETGSRRKSSE